MMSQEHVDLKPKGLPQGWRREVVIRKNGMSAGKTDVYYYSPCGKKFRSKPQIARFLGDNADLTCFDFSRAGSLGERRRAARDRNPAGARRMDLKQTPPPPAVRPLSNTPLRPSGPIRRTCGVIKLPVTLVSSSSNAAIRDSILGTPPTTEQKPTSLSLIVQSLWERRLSGVVPHDHSTGKELSRTHSPTPELFQTRPSPPVLAPSSSPRPQQSLSSLLTASSSSSSGTGNACPQRTPPPPPSLNHVPSPLPNKLLSTAVSHSQLTGTRLLLQQQPTTHQSLSSSSSSSSSSPQLPVTDSDVLMQEQRVLLLRQQLMAAQRVL